jgi:hypothetical protein
MIGTSVYLVEFGSGDLADPQSVPIGIEYDKGNRYYLWDEHKYGEVILPNNSEIRELVRTKEHLTIINRFKKYWSEPSPNPYLCNVTSYCRVIYRISKLR